MIPNHKNSTARFKRKAQSVSYGERSGRSLRLSRGQRKLLLQLRPNLFDKPHRAGSRQMIGIPVEQQEEMSGAFEHAAGYNSVLKP